jgi:hypothetical protein
MLDLAHETQTIVANWRARTRLTGDEKQRLRDIVAEARSVLADAGYPAEGVWRAVQRASLGVDTSFQQVDPLYWEDVIRDLQSGIETLESLVSRQTGREADFRIVG